MSAFFSKKSVVRVCTVVFAVGGLLLASPRQAHANTPYYIDSVDGNDGNDGRSVENAKKTLTNVNFAVPGDKILFKAGQTFNYPEILTLDKAGTKAAPIELGRYGVGANPILKSTITRTSNVYVIKVASPYWIINGLTIQGHDPVNQVISGVTYKTTKTNGGIEYASSRTQNITPDGYELEVKNCTILNVNVGIVVDNPVTNSVNIHDNIITDLYPLTGAAAKNYPVGIRTTNTINSVIKNNQIMNIDKAVIGSAHVGVGIEIFSGVTDVQNIDINHNFFTDVYNPLKIGPSLGSPAGKIKTVDFAYNIVKNARVPIFFDALYQTTLSNGTVFTAPMQIDDVDLDHNVFKNDPTVTVETVVKLHAGTLIPTGTDFTNNVLDFPSVTKFTDSFPITMDGNLYHTNPGQQLPGYTPGLPLGPNEVAADPGFIDNGDGLDEFDTPPGSPVDDVFDDGEEFDPDHIGPQPDTTVPVYCAQDLNQDGVTDTNDYSIFITDFLKPVSEAINIRSDIDGSGFIDVTDFSRMLNGFFQICT